MTEESTNLDIETLGLVRDYARLWPRQIFDYSVSKPGAPPRFLADEFPILDQPGVYVLYRDDTPCFIGKAYRVGHRLQQHARQPSHRIDYAWNFFSIFVIDAPELRAIVESILLAAIPDASSARPKQDQMHLPRPILDMLADLRTRSLASSGE